MGAGSVGLTAEGPGTWGILGGTFDPIHYAHLAVAEQTREALDLVGVLFLPAGIPPHKSGRSITPSARRVEMVELAIADNPGFTLSRVEVDRPGPSYAVETLEELLETGDGSARSDYVFILSAEAFGELPSWRDPDRLLELCRLAVVPRLGHASPGREWVAQRFPGREERVVFLEGPELGHSASEIRRRAGAGRSIRYLVPPAVERYIRDHRIYGDEDVDRGLAWQKN